MRKPLDGLSPVPGGLERPGDDEQSDEKDED